MDKREQFIKSICYAIALSFFSIGFRSLGYVNDNNEPPNDTCSKIIDFVFSRDLTTSAVTKAILYRDRGYSFTNTEALIQFYLDSANIIRDSAQPYRDNEKPLESPYWWKVQEKPGAEDEFLQNFGQVLACEISNSCKISLPVFSTPLQKLLAQRDLLQSYGLIFYASTLTKNQKLKGLAGDLKRIVACLFEKTLLSKEDFELIASERPSKISAPFTTSITYNLKENYLPKRVVTDDRSWMQIPETTQSFFHFKSYGGRSFIKIYVRIPKYSNKDIFALWESLYHRYGGNLHINGLTQLPPQGMELMLVRTTGTFLTDGSYKDSFIPEEIIIRRFKYSAPKLDYDTSDFRGTLFYQYRLSRSSLMTNPSSLTLKRIYDDDAEYYGFFGDVPDRINAYSDTITTMRMNCISCHSELFYGLNTIFSFERNPGLNGSSNVLEDGMLIRNGENDFQLKTQDVEDLKKWLSNCKNFDDKKSN